MVYQSLWLGEGKTEKKKKKKTGWFSMVNPDYEIGFVVAKPMISDILKNIP